MSRPSLRNVPGSYTMAIADWRKRDVIVLRDRTGIRPGMLGWKDGKYGVASEDIAFRKNGGDCIEDIEPGSIYYLSPEGDYSKESLVAPAQTLLLRVELHRRRRLHHQPRRRPADPGNPRGDPGRGVQPLRRRRRHIPAPLPRGGGAFVLKGARPSLPADHVARCGVSAPSRCRRRRIARRRSTTTFTSCRGSSSSLRARPARHRRQHHPRQQLDPGPAPALRGTGRQEGLPRLLMLYRVVNHRYLHSRPMIFTTNKPLAALGGLLHDGDVAEAILDRTLERGTHFVLRGPSYRTRHLTQEDDTDVADAA